MKTIRIYSDESRHVNERFMLLSGIWIEEPNVLTVQKLIDDLRHRHGFLNSEEKQISFMGEFKWQKISDKYFTVYQELVDLFFEWISKDLMRFCCMLIDTQNHLIIKYNNIKKEGYFKLLYQLYYQNSKIPAIYKIYPDSISNETIKVNLPKLNKCLDNSFVKKFSMLVNPSDSPGAKGYINNITPIDSKSSDFIQIVDVVMGAIGYFQNGLFRKEGAKKAKVRMMKYIFEKMMLSRTIFLFGKTYYTAKSTKFNIWVFKPKKLI